MSHAAWALPIPASQLLEVRLRHGLSSYTAVEGDPVEAVLAAPVILNGRVALPAGALLNGKVVRVAAVGLGIIHERASLEIEFNKLSLADGTTIDVKTRLFGIENAREKIDKHGRIQGIRSTNTPGFRAASVLTGLAAVDPIALLFSTAAFTATLRFSDPEIHWMPGAELIVELLEGIESKHNSPPEVVAVTQNASERAELVSVVKALPYRTERSADNAKSDVTNVMLIGKPEAIARAFAAAGWVEAVASDASSKYRSLRAFAETQPYQEAPMSELSLNGEEAVLTLSKTLNTFTRRHHLRLYAWGQSWGGLPIFQAAATHDTDIVMSLRKRTITHAIDSNIDEERAKVVNDLNFTGCVDGAEWVERPWVEEELKNGNGQLIETDRAIAVVRLNDCEQPADAGVSRMEGPVRRANPLERGTRQAVLRFRNDVLRGNLIWQGAAWSYRLSQMLNKDEKVAGRIYERQTFLGALPGRAEPTFKAELEDGGSMVAPLDVKTMPKRREASLGGSGEWTTPTVELGFTFGTSLFCQSTVGEEAWIFTGQMKSSGAISNLALTAGNEIRPGQAIGGSVTVHSNRWISNELGFYYLRGSFRLGLQKVGMSDSDDVSGLVEQQAGLLTRQFSYNTIVHIRPLESRWRPYLAAGPALQLVHLTDAPFRGSKGIYRLGLSNVGMLESAYNFNNAPPLDGGGIFQPALQVGGGLKYRFRNCWILKIDYRNTMSHRPDLLRKSLAPIVDDVQPIQNARTHEWFAQQRLSVGFSFTF